MAVFVDSTTRYPVKLIDRKARRFGRDWCHMAADTPEELDEMAALLGLKPAWKQKASTAYEHYDLTPDKRAQAVELGAVELSRKDLVRWVLSHRQDVRP